MSTFELSHIIVENGITTRTELLEFAEGLCGEEKTDIAEFVVNRESLVVAEVLQTAWEVKPAKKTSSVQGKAGSIFWKLLRLEIVCLTAMAFGIAVLIR